MILYVKKLDDGSVVHAGEVRTGRKRLAAVSLRKYPATMDVNRIESAPHHYVQGDSENQPSVVRNPSVAKGEDLLHQSDHSGQVSRPTEVPAGVRAGYDPSRRVILLTGKIRLHVLRSRGISLLFGYSVRHGARRMGRADTPQKNTPKQAWLPMNTAETEYRGDARRWLTRLFSLCARGI